MEFEIRKIEKYYLENDEARKFKSNLDKMGPIEMREIVILFLTNLVQKKLSTST
jgi:hypothetical protein